jgi:class 3 adenylate cyclase
VFIIVPWGVALVIHASIVLVGEITGTRRRRRRSRREKERERRRQDLRDHGMPVPPSGPVPPVPPHRRKRTTAPVRQWTVVMFTDIARSTPLAERLGDEAWANLVAEHRATVREVLAAHHGHEVGTQGDGFLCRFESPDDAVSAAVDLQTSLATERARGSFAPEVRVGLHAGEAIDGHDDLLGNAVNLAARVMGVAEPGEILVTEPVADHLRPGRELEDRGLHELKGITRARHLLAVRWTESAPGDTVDLRDGGQPRT